MKTTIFAAAVLVVSGCSSYSVTTNLDPENFRNYYKPSFVKVVTEDDLKDENRYKFLGVVGGLSCKARAHDYIANETDARTDARIKAVDLGANAVKFGKCVRLEKTPACEVSITCYAEALILDDKAK